MIKNKFEVGDEVLVRHPRHGLDEQAVSHVVSKNGIGQRGANLSLTSPRPEGRRYAARSPRSGRRHRAR